MAQSYIRLAAAKQADLLRSVEKLGRRASLEARVLAVKKACVEAAGGKLGDEFSTFNFTWREGFVDRDNRKVWTAQSVHYDMPEMSRNEMHALYAKVEALGFDCDMRWPSEAPRRHTGVLYISEKPPARTRWFQRGWGYGSD